MGAIKHDLYIGEHMITNDEKIEALINRLDNLELIIKSFIDHAEDFKDKYSLEEELFICNAKKNVLLEELTKLGGVWTGALTNQG
jgi:hypothetical protein